MLRSLAFLAVAAFPQLSAAQITVTLTSDGISGPAIVAAGTDITAAASAPGGLALQGSGPGWTSMTTIQHFASPDQIALAIDSSGSCDVIQAGTLAIGVASTTDMTMELVAPAPVEVEIDLIIPRQRYVLDQTTAHCQGRNAVHQVTMSNGQMTTYGSDPDCISTGFFDFEPCTRTISATIGPVPTTLDIDVNMFASASAFLGPGRCSFVNSNSIATDVVIRPRSQATAYGVPCNGAELSMTPANFGATSETLSLVGDPTDVLGLLLVGTGQTSVQVPGFGCDLLVSGLVADVFLPIGTTGDIQLPIQLPPLGVFTLQGVTTDAQVFRFSNGLQL